MFPRRPAAAVLVVFGLAALAPAAGSRDPWLRPGESVRAVLSGAGESKFVAFAGVEGTKLDVRVAAAGGSRVVPRITVLAPDGVPADVGDTNPRDKGGARVDGLALGATGIWRIGVETPQGRGGAFVLTATARGPLKSSWSRTLGTDADEFVLPAAPGGSVSVSVAAEPRTAFDPVVELIAPSGAVVATDTGVHGRAELRRAALRELGDYTVRVSGGPGAFTARAALRPAKRRQVSYRDVESAPDVAGFSPGTTTNQAVVTVFLDGVGFTGLQKVSIADGDSVLASASAQPFGHANASALLDLSDVPPGTYDLRVTTPGGRTVRASAPFVVANRAPTIASITPSDATSTRAFALQVLGDGFDLGAELRLRRAEDGSDVPFVVTGRTGHGEIEATVSPAAYATGPCIVEVRDPDGSGATVSGALDLLGPRAAPGLAYQVAGPPAPNLAVDDAAYDEENGRVLLALRDGPARAAFVLFDPETRTASDSLTIEAADLGGGQLGPVRVAWDAVGGTFALCVCSTASPSYAVVRIVSAADIHQTLVQQQLSPASSDHMSRIDAAANPDDGGYLVAWDQFDQQFGRRIRAQRVGPAATIDTSAQTTVAWDPYGNFADPVVAYQGASRFVVAWASLTDDRQRYAVRAIVTALDGEPVPGLGPYDTAVSSAWTATARPELARNPADGSMLLTYWYSEGVVYRPASQRLAPGTALPGASAKLDLALAFPGGVASGVVWNSIRSEFVVTVVTYSNRVVLRRVNSDGSLRPAPVVESYEGASGVPYAWAAPGTLGLVRVSDGVADDVHDTATTKLEAVAGPMR